MKARPLQWPQSVANPTDWQKVLMGFWHFGPDIHAYKQFRAEIAAREESCLECWMLTERERQARDLIVKIVAGIMDWPNAHFLPDDPMDILLQQEPLDLSAGETLVRIEAQFQISLPEDCHKLRLGEFVSLVEKMCPVLPERSHPLAQ